MRKSLNPRQVNNSKLTLNQLLNYCKEQFKHPPTNYFDEVHMDKIKQFVEEFDRTPIEKPSDVNSIITDEICNSPITMDEMLAQIAKLNSRKAEGADGISGEFIKYT